MKKLARFGVFIGLSVLCAGLCACEPITIQGKNGFIYDSGSGSLNPNTAGYTMADGEISLENITGLNIDWASGRVTIGHHNADTVVFYETSNQTLSDDDKMQYCVDNGTLKIAFQKWDRSFRIQILQKDLTILLPEGIKLDEFVYDGASAECDFDCIDAKSIAFDTASGKIVGDKLHADEEINVDAASGAFIINEELTADTYRDDTASGAINVNNASVRNKIMIDSSSGAVNLDMATVCDVSCDTASGAVSLTLPSDASVQIAYDTGSGEFTSNAKFGVSGDVYTLNDGKHNFDVDTASGNLTVNIK